MAFSLLNTPDQANRGRMLGDEDAILDGTHAQFRCDLHALDIAQLMSGC